MKLIVKSYWLILVVTLFAGGIVIMLFGEADNVNNFKSPGQFSVMEYLTPGDSSKFLQAIGPRKFSFPEEFNVKPQYRSGWWYYTGNLQTENGRRFGFHLTFFRNALSPGEVDPAASDWKTNQIFMAHFAITDITMKQFYNFQRFSRPVLNLAGLNMDPFEIWLESWSVRQLHFNDKYKIPDVKLYAREENIELDLHLRSLKAPVLQGERGFSRKGPGQGNASYYFSLTRLKANGTISLPDMSLHVEGDAWMDREWSTSVLSENQVGWDWFALQFSDTTEIMLYRIREKGGRISSFSELTYIDKNGEKFRIDYDRVKLSILDTWESPEGDIYPSGWALNIPELKLDLNIQPFLKNQEFEGYIQYWEGAVEVYGTKQGIQIAGHGYVELTGYADEGLPVLQ